MAAVDPAFKGVGNQAGLMIWRIEKMQVVPWERKMYGKFYSGDSYIILNTKKKSAGFEWDIHFWLGKETSQDEKGVAAFKTVELDESLGGGPVQYREVEGHESTQFLCLFPRGVQYLSGGIESGFTKVEKDKYEPRILHVKGRRNIRVQQVKVSWKSLNFGDAFIVDFGLKIYVWLGSEVGRMEKIKAGEVARRINDEERGARAVVEFVESGKEPEEFIRDMMKAADGMKTDISPATDDATYERQSKEQLTLYKVSDASGELEVTEISHYPLKREMLDTNDAFIVDTGVSSIFAWIGKGATTQEKKGAMKNAQGFVQSKGYPDWTQVSMVREGTETPLFKQNFVDWLNKGENSGLPVYKSKAPREQFKFDATQMHKAGVRESEKCVDDGAGTLEIWRIENFEMEPIPKNKYGHFYEGDSYVVLYTYLANGKEKYIIYFWLGQESSQDERGAAALHAVALDDKYGGAPVQVRVVQHKEPEHFYTIFKGQMVVHCGGKASGFKNKEDSDSYDTDGTRLFQIKGTNRVNTRAVQRPETASSLNSNDCFVLETPKATYIWYGKGCSGDERDMANSVAGAITPSAEPQKISEGSEPSEFWDALGGQGEYASGKIFEEVLPSNPPRLFQCSNAKGRFLVEEIFDFAQEDMVEEDVMILDIYDSLYVWVGRGANDTEKKEALRVAQEYVKSDPSGRDPDACTMTQIKQGFEPLMFTSHFLDWNPELWTNDASFETYRQSLQGKATSANVATASKVYEVREIPYSQLKGGKCPEGVDPTNKEKYLSEDEFKAVLKVTIDEFNKMPKWKQNDTKKKAELF
uniref:Villin n=1 Tax=Halisarca dujardinii TaxID=2583056 RepID=A0A9E9JM46_HALDU|nr:villin [Halisarca dujardinii]